MKVYIGTGGYTNDDWIGEGLLYPPGTKQTDFLSVYAQHFDAVELNSSFYGIPGLKAFEGMARKSAGRTRFAVKLNKVFTHDRAPQDSDFDRMLQSPQPLREAGVMGPYLAQFPYSFHRTPGNRTTCATWPSASPGTSWPWNFATRAGTGPRSETACASSA